MKSQITLSALFFGTVLLGTSCTRSAQGGAPQAFPAMHVQTQAAQEQKVGDYTEYLATLKSRSSSVLQPEVEGQILKIFVKSGDHVQPGQVLMEIDPRRQEATLNSGEANSRSRRAALDYNAKELERRKGLFAAGVISRQDLDQAQSSYDSSKADVDALDQNVNQQRVQLRYFSVYAPTAGVIGDIPVRVGDRVTNATNLTTLDQGNMLEAYISVPAEKSAGVRVGMPVILAADDGTSVTTTVSFVSSRVDPASQLLLVKANVPNTNGHFRNDQVLHARVVWSQTGRPMLPVPRSLESAAKTSPSSSATTKARPLPSSVPSSSATSSATTTPCSAGFSREKKSSPPALTCWWTECPSFLSPAMRLPPTDPRPQPPSPSAETHSCLSISLSAARSSQRYARC